MNRMSWLGFRLRVGVIALVLGSMGIAVCADPVSPTRDDRQVALAVATLLRRDHLSKRAVDDEISKRSLENFIKMLDPLKVYFYQSDVDSFMEHENEVDDMIKRADVSLAFDVFKVFLERVDERVKAVDELLERDFDFTIDERIVLDRDAGQFPRDEAEARDKWRRRIKYDLLVQKADEVEGREARDKLHRRYHSFAKRMHQTDNEELLEMFLSSLTTSFDPHTTYMSRRTLENFEIIMRLELEGIGASLKSEDGYTQVHKIIPGGAADKDGRLKPGDRIVGVGQGRDGEIVDVVDMKLSDVVSLIRGKRGTVVLLEVTPAGKQERKVIDIVRAKIELTDSEAQAEVFTVGAPPDSKSYKVGVIELPSFYMDMAGARQGLPDFKSTTRDVRRILDDFKAKGVDAVVLDLRRNGGGSLTEAINLTGLFIEDGPVVQVKDSDGRVQPYLDLDPEIAWRGPLVVLVSKFSASASEILAGAVQDYGRGLIVGDTTTHGKGTVQSLLDIGQQLFPRLLDRPKLGALKVTMQQFYRPSGDSTQNRGVISDLELPSLSSHLDVGEADLDYSLKFDRVDPVTYKQYNLVNRAICDRLRELSGARCRQSEDFQKVLDDIQEYKKQKAKKAVSLNEETFFAERAEMNADDEEKKKIEELNDPDSTGIERDYYLDEALAITLDYLNLLQPVHGSEAPQAVRK